MIYNDKYREFLSYSNDKNMRYTKIYVPIDFDRIANHFGVDKDIIFGRLYYHFEKKYSYQDRKEAFVHFFICDFEGDGPVINFPLMSSVLAGMIEENKRNSYTLYLSIAAFIISSISIGFNIAYKTGTLGQAKTPTQCHQQTAIDQ